MKLVNQNSNPKETLTFKEKLKVEGKRLLLTIAVVLVICQIAFYKESFFNVAKFSLSFLYFSLLPGYALMMLLADQLKPELRIILSFPVGLAVYAIVGYYLNMIWPIKYLLVIPLAVILTCGLVYYYKNKKIRAKENIP